MVVQRENCHYLKKIIVFVTKWIMLHKIGAFFSLGLNDIWSIFYNDSKQIKAETICNSMKMFLTQQHYA